MAYASAAALRHTMATLNDHIRRLIGGDRSFAARTRRALHLADLSNGTGVASARRLGPVDIPAIEAHLLRLSDDDRRMRFCGAMSDGAIRQFVRTLNWDETFWIGYFADDLIVGLAELAQTGPFWKREAEFAVSVDADWRGVGMGRSLLTESLRIARASGLRRLILVLLTENRSMAHIAKALGASKSMQAGMTTCTFRIARKPLPGKLAKGLKYLAGRLRGSRAAARP